MTLQSQEPQSTWTIAEAEAQLSEILRLADSEGPQRIGKDKPVILVPEREWRPREVEADRTPIGQWLMEHWPRYGDLQLPDRNEPDREIPHAKEGEAEAPKVSE